MRPEIKPLARGRIAGRAVTVMIAPASSPAPSFDPLFAAVDASGPGPVLVASNDGDRTISCMGDLIVTGLHARGAEGAVMDGAVRDIEPMLERASRLRRQREPGQLHRQGRRPRPRRPDHLRRCRAAPGRAILADWDGVVVIPQKKAATVLGEVLVKEKAERTIRERIREAAGGSPLADIFAEFE